MVSAIFLFMSGPKMLSMYRYSDDIDFLGNTLLFDTINILNIYYIRLIPPPKSDLCPK